MQAMLPRAAARLAEMQIEQCMHLDEVREVMDTREVAVLKHSRITPRLEGDLRSAVVYAFGHTSFNNPLSAVQLLQVITLLDGLYDRMRLAEHPASLPSACIAVQWLIAKVDDVEAQGQLARSDEERIWHFAQNMHRLGQLTEVAVATRQTDPGFCSQLDVLQAMQWRVELPTVHTWLLAFVDRFNAGTGSALAGHLNADWLFKAAVKMHGCGQQRAEAPTRKQMVQQTRQMRRPMFRQVQQPRGHMANQRVAAGRRHR